MTQTITNPTDHANKAKTQITCRNQNTGNSNTTPQLINTLMSRGVGVDSKTKHRLDGHNTQILNPIQPATVLYGIIADVDQA
jgi:hypothetical protein